jgi:hypothetical protein
MNNLKFNSGCEGDFVFRYYVFRCFSFAEKLVRSCFSLNGHHILGVIEKRHKKRAEW